jgi:hypothetical protein
VAKFSILFGFLVVRAVLGSFQLEGRVGFSLFSCCAQVDLVAEE